MGDNFINSIQELYKDRKWKEIIDKYHNHEERSKVLWVFLSEENLKFLKDCLDELKSNRIVSVGCGSGLLEWIIMEATDIPVIGVEVDGAWWHCKYAPPTFIPLLITHSDIDKDVIRHLQAPTSTLLFCYFNNRPAFEEYLKHFLGNVLVIIGPGEGKAVHTDPKPFGDVSDQWNIYKWQEVRQSKDFICVYCRDTIV